MVEYDAELRNWRELGNAYYGEIWNDSKGRFPNGHTVKTSKVVKVEDNILHTRNTRYLLVKVE